MAAADVSREVPLPPFQTLLDAHGRDVHRFLVATVGRVDADDCYQETWLAALRAYPRLRDASNLRAWIMKIAHHKAIDHIRGRTRRPVAVESAVVEATLGAAGSVAGSPASAPADAGVERDGVWAPVAELPPKQRAAVAMRFLLDSAYEEIAAAMGTSEDAARRNVHEGLKRLRKELEP
jgi:RNA polymerase sigma factor (sigma-70 family)